MFASAAFALAGGIFVGLVKPVADEMRRNQDMNETAMRENEVNEHGKCR